MARARRGSRAVPVGVATAWVTPRGELGIREWEKLAPVTAATRGAAGSRRTATVDSPFPQGIGHLDPTLHPPCFIREVPETVGSTRTSSTLHVRTKL